MTFMSRRSPIFRALWVALAAMSATAVYETTEVMCFPRMSVLQSHIITIFFAGCVGFCISFVVRRRDMAAQQQLLRLAIIVQQSDDAINSVALDGTVTSWNAGAERTYGYSSAEALGRHISFCLPPEKHGELNGLLQKIAAGEVIERFDTQRLTKRGAIIDVSLSVSAIKDKTGTIVGVSGIGRDVTAQRRAQDTLRVEVMAREQAESELRRSEERMRIAMKAAKIGFWDLDVIKDEHVWSDTCKALLGVAPDSPANYQSLMNAVHPDDWKMMQAEIDGAIQEKRDYIVEYRVVWPDNSVHWRTSSGQAFYDDTERVTRMSGITMDIDDRKQAEERVQFLAYYDALTGLPNRTLLRDRLAKCIRWCSPPKV